MLTLIIPFHRDTERLAHSLSAIDAYRNMHPNLLSEVILVHNGISEVPKLILPTFAKTLHTNTLGLGAAYRLGISAATSSWCLLSASDLPFGFSDVDAAALDTWQRGIYIGSKLHEKSDSRSHGSLRLILSRIFYYWRFLVLDVRLPRDTQGTILLPTDIAKKLVLEVEADDFFFTTELLYRAACRGLSIRELPIRQLPQISSSSVRFWHDGFTLFYRTFRLRSKK